MVERRTVSQCVSSDYCKGWNDAVDEMPKWISCEDRLPKDKEKVLVYEGGVMQWQPSVCTATFHKGRTYEEIKNSGSLSFRFCDEYGNNKKPYAWTGDAHMKWFGQYITHWQPLPQPPKEV